MNYLTHLTALVWLANGLICKVLNLVPRHEAIVARILGDEFARPVTLLIGLAEIGIAIWIWSGVRSRLCARIQILLVAIMNSIEFVLAPDLLLWGRWNMLFAGMFVMLVYYDAFHLRSPAKHELS